MNIPFGPKLHAIDGVLTQNLVQTPGQFGLGQVPNRLTPDATTSMVCGYCSTGCSLNIHLRDGEAINLTPSVDYPVNQGMACPKGWEALAPLQSADRGVAPSLLEKNGRRRDISWDDALTTFCDRFRKIGSKYGPESVAFISTGQMPTEEMAFLGALAKFGMGMIHGDGNTRQCMATAVVAYKQAFGFDAPPYTYQDFEESDCLVFIGSNLCVAHPIMWQRVLNNRHQPHIIVIDPRRTETAMAATDHLALAPKSDLKLLYALAQLLIQKGLIDEEFVATHTNGFEDFKNFLSDFSLEDAAATSGIELAELHRIAELIGNGKRVSFWWTMGVNQSYEGVRVAQAIINLALMTGNIGRPGTGANSITGQCNAMGSRLFSNTTNLLGGRDFTSASDRSEVAEILGIDPEVIPAKPSLPYHEIIEGILRGRIKGLWIICTNTAHSWINQNTCREILDRLEFLVVQDMYPTTETAKLADLYLPAAGWGEKEGTFINSERRLGVLKKVAKAPGEALADFSIFRAIAEYWGCGEMFANWKSPGDVFELLKKLSQGKPCDISGIRDYQMIDSVGGIQWPYPAESPPKDTQTSQRRLFEDGKFYHPDGKAKFLFEAPREMPEPPNTRFPYLLLTGRGTAAQWHTQTRTRKSEVLKRLGPEQAYVEIHPQDAREENILPNQEVIVESQRGSIRVKAFVTPTVQRGQLFIAMHYEGANKLTLAHFDPYSHQPSYKNCAVRVRKAEVWDVEAEK